MDTPDDFNVLIEFVCSRVVVSWEERGFGVRLDDSTLAITHLIWRDNIYIFASRWDHFQVMCREVGEALRRHKLTLKASSLEYLQAWQRDHAGAGGIDVLGSTMREIEEMIVLGTKLDARGATWRSVDYRLVTAEGHVWAHVKTLMGVGPIHSKVQAWQAGPCTTGIF